MWAGPRASAYFGNSRGKCSARMWAGSHASAYFGNRRVLKVRVQTGLQALVYLETIGISNLGLIIGGANSFPEPLTSFSGRKAGPQATRKRRFASLRKGRGERTWRRRDSEDPEPRGRSQGKEPHVLFLQNPSGGRRHAAEGGAKVPRGGGATVLTGAGPRLPASLTWHDEESDAEGRRVRGWRKPRAACYVGAGSASTVSVFTR